MIKKISESIKLIQKFFNKKVLSIVIFNTMNSHLKTNRKIQ